MMQWVFFGLFAIAILTGLFAYYEPLQKPIHPIQSFMDSIGYTQEQDHNQAKSEQINVMVDKGVMRMRRRVEDLALAQSQMLQAVLDQKRVLNDTNEKIASMLLISQRSDQFDNDILRFKSLAAQMQDSQRLLINRGQSLVEMNDDLTAQRELLADELKWNNINAQTSLQSMKDQAEALKNQVASLCDKARQYNQQVEAQIANMQAKIAQISDKSKDNANKQQTMRDRLRLLLEHEQDQFNNLVQQQQQNRQDAQDARDALEDSQEILNGEVEQAQDTIADDRQKDLDEQDAIRQKIADQEQRMQDERSQQGL